MSESATIKHTEEVEVEIEVGVYSVDDSGGNSVSFCATLDTDNDFIVTVEGFVIDSDDHELLERARALTEDDWDLIATSQLIEQ